MIECSLVPQLLYEFGDRYYIFLSVYIWEHIQVFDFFILLQGPNTPKFYFPKTNVKKLPKGKFRNNSKTWPTCLYES